MERTVLKELIEWKERADRKPLILNGARQVGKTWLLHEFARLEYKKEAYVVCRKNNLARQLFTQDFDVERILRGLRAMTSVDITPGDTLVILDEVQDIPEVLEALKYFKEEAPDYHIAVAGSLLGISLHENVSYPVGKVNVINLYPMSFEVQGYDLDFSKHAPKEQVPRIRMVWNSVPSQLFKENKKFIYGALRKGARANDFELSIQWLVNAGLLYKVPRCAKPELPLAVYEDLSAFKLYMVDLGLMGAMVQTDPAQVLIKNDIFKEYKGGLTEQYVLQQMKSNGVSPIYYHTADNSRLELDFIIQRGAEMIPIEVKAEGNVRANSLMNLLDKEPSLHAERYSMLPYKEQGNLTNIPLYAV